MLDKYSKEMLLMLYPGKEQKGNKPNELVEKASQMLTVDLPTLQHICEPKAIICDRRPAFVVMAEQRRTCIRSYEVQQLRNTTAKTLRENSSLEEETTHVLQTLHSPSNNDELAVKS